MTSQSRLLQVLTILSPLLVMGIFAMALWYAPVERSMGMVQKLFYFHIATAWVGMLGFLAAAAAGVTYLVKRDLRWDIVELAAVEISLVFFCTAIVLGSIWAKPSWGTYWTWEPRLTTAAVLVLVYAAYLLLRQGLDDPEQRARFGAVYTLVGGLSVPVTFLSIRIFRTIHPVVIAAGEGTGMNMEAAMLQTMIAAILAFSIVFVTLLWQRIRLGGMQALIDRRQAEQLEREQP